MIRSKRVVLRSFSRRVSPWKLSHTEGFMRKSKSHIAKALKEAEAGLAVAKVAR